MQNNLGDYLKRRADQLGLDRADRLAEIQAWLDEHYAGMAKAVSLHEGVLTLKVTSSAAASELRFGAPIIKQQFMEITTVKLTT